MANELEQLQRHDLRPLRVLVAAAAACSPPPKQTDRPAHPSVATDASVRVDAAVRPDAEDTSVFPWQQIRDEHEAFMKSPIDACDWRWVGVQRTRIDHNGKTKLACPNPPRPQLLAGQVTQYPTGASHSSSEVVFDIGRDDDLSEKWVAALLDETDRVISSWAHPHQVGRYISRVVVDVPIYIAELKVHVALRRKAPFDGQ